MGQGGSDASAWGVAFTAPGGTLTSWSFVTDGGGNAGNVVFNVAQWGGSSITGTPLYSSAPTLLSGGSDQTLSFTGLGLSLTAGDSYVAYLDTNGVNQPPYTFFLGGTSKGGGGPPVTVLDAYGVNDYFGFDPLNDTWRKPGRDVGPAFSATFVSAVPLPAALPLFGAALAGVAVWGRRRAKTRA